MIGLGNFITQEGTQALEKGVDDSCPPTQWLACLLATRAYPCDPWGKEAGGGAVLPLDTQPGSVLPPSAASYQWILFMG